MSDSQTQKSGPNSTNIQGRDITINQGVSFDEARQIALDLFNSNFVRLSTQAAELAQIRIGSFVEDFLKKLQQRNPESINTLKNPSMQYALYTAQKEYARTGDDDLGGLLVDILVDRAKHDDRDLIQIVLDESLSVAPKLTAAQFDMLSLIFILKYSINKGLGNLDKLREYINVFLVPFLPSLTKEMSCYQHLEFAGCGSISIGSRDIESIFLENYPGLFSKGFTIEEFKTSISPDEVSTEILIPCLNEKSKLQIQALNNEGIDALCKQRSYRQEVNDKLKGIQNSHLMSTTEMKPFLITIDGRMDELFRFWSDSVLQNMTLTSVGIAIAHANIRRKTGITIDLSIWIK